jgi:hypothetical protein
LLAGNLYRYYTLEQELEELLLKRSYDIKMDAIVTSIGANCSAEQQ